MPSVLVLEVVHVDAQRIALRPIVGAAVLEVADQLLLLRVDGDDRLPFGLRRHDLRVDVLELRVAIGMLRAFVRLAIVLAREAELHQLLAHRVGADRMAHLRQRRGELVHALRHPDQRAHGIAERRRLDEALQARARGRIALAATALRPPPLRRTCPFGSGAAVEIVLAAIDRRAGEPGDPRHDRETAPAGRLHLGRREQAPPALVELRADRLPAIANGIFVDHATDLRLFAEIRNPASPSHTDARPRSAIQLLFGMS